MANKNRRSDTSVSTNPPARERRRTVRATTRTPATTANAAVAETDGSPAVLSDTVRDTANELQTQGDGSTSNTPTFEQISEAAYHRYLQRGGQDGHDFDDWLDAERSLRSRR